MTAGLHHRWRARAADLAAVGPGDRVLDVATGTGDLAIELARRVGPERRGRSARTSPRRCSTRARRKAPELRFEWGNALELPYADDALRRGDGRLRRAQLLRPRPRPAEMARVVRPGGRVVVLEITTPQRPPLSTFFRVWFDRVVPLLGRARRRLATPTATCRAPSGASRARRASPRRWRAPGLRDIRWILTAGGIIAIHVGTKRLTRGGRRPGHRGRPRRRRPRARRCWRASRSACAALAAGHGATLAEHARRDDRRRRQAPAAAARVPRRRRRRRATGARARRRRGRARPQRDARPRRRPRRRRAAPRAADGRRQRRAASAATATGDLLFARAFAELAAQRPRRGGPRAVATRARALAEGELLPARRRLGRRRSRSSATCARCELKTARLFEAACRLGALEAGGDADALGAFGRRIGLAFQLLDDVLDVSGPAERTGKHRGTDLLDGTVTLPLHPRPRARPRARGARPAGDPRPRRRPSASATASRRPARSTRRAARALEIVDDAKARLPRRAAGPRSARALELVADGVVARYA